MLCRGVFRIVEGELSDREAIDPIILVVGDIGTKVRLERLAGRLSEFIHLRVVRCRSMRINLQKTGEF